MEGGIFLLSRTEFIRISLETNLFFQRIMKEHLFFIQTSLQPVESDTISQANLLKKSFEELLCETLELADGAISKEVLESNELVTPYTLELEKINSMLTGVSIDTNITKSELKLQYHPDFHFNEWLESCIININARSKNLLEEVISFQEKLLEQVLDCKIFIGLYPEMLKHDTEEAKYYLEILKSLQKKTLPKHTLCQELNFWNHIMGEHAEFIDGMLDPTEKDIKKILREFIRVFEILVKKCSNSPKKQMLQDSFKATGAIRDFKKTSTEASLECKMPSIIPPLLLDHVLREANHYLRLLQSTNK